MRWKEHEAGDTRKRWWFAFWPVKIGKETRWLEWVHVYEIMSPDQDVYGDWLYWKKHSFLN